MDPIAKLNNNIQEALTLMEIHENITGTSPGRRFNVETLNKSCIVLITACFEALIEDLAQASIKFILANAKTPDKLPSSIKKGIAKKIKNDPHDLSPWKLAEKRWKDAAEEYLTEIERKHIAVFNTPKPENIDDLFQTLLDVEKITTEWKWKNTTSKKAKETLTKYLQMRHEIAHQLSTSKKIYKTNVLSYAKFVLRISAITSNRIRDRLKQNFGRSPWAIWSYRSTQ